MSAEENLHENVMQQELNVVNEVEENLEDSYDYSNLSKAELILEAARIRSEQAISVAKNQLKDLKEAFGSIFYTEKEDAYQRFIEEGGEKDGFEFIDVEGQKFFDTLKEISELRRKHKVTQEEQRVGNTIKKKQLLNELRELVDGDETTNTFNEVKEIQKKWKETGQIAQADYQELNANYQAVLDRYYSFRSIYFDLKSLDRDKNYELKTALIEEAKQLLLVENTLDATRTLNELHAQYKEIGPVPEELSEPLWQQFKEVTDQVRERRAQYLEHAKVQQQKNLVAKRELLAMFKDFTHVQPQSAKEWVAKTDDLVKFQETFKKLGLVPEEAKKEINDEFWSYVRAFYASKNEFFAGLDDERKRNHEKKLVLIEKVKALKDSDDFKNTAEAIKQLQGQWKKLGQSPKAVNESVFQEFRAACDFFFSRRSAQYEEQEKEFEANLALKQVVIEKISLLSSAAQKSEFEELTNEFHAIGFVPRNHVKKIQDEFLKSTDVFIAKLTDLSEDDIQTMKLSVELGAIKGTPAEKDFIQDKTRKLRAKIGGLQEELATLTNNIEFFANSKSFASLKADVDKKVVVLEQEIAVIKGQLKLLRIQE